MTFDLGLYPQSHSAVTSPIPWITFICGTNITHGDDHFPVNRSKDNVTRAIRIFVVWAMGILTLVDQDLQFVVMMTSSNGNIFRVTGPLCEEFTSQKPVTRSFDVFFDLRLNKRLSKQSRRRWFEIPLRSLWRHCNVNSTPCSQALAIGLKMRNISRPWPNLSSFEGSQDTSACQISGQYCHAFFIKYGNHTFEMFLRVKMPQKLVKLTDRDQNLFRWPGYSSIWYFRPFPHAFSRKCPKILNLTRFTRFFFGLCDLEICHMTLKIWEP